LLYHTIHRLLPFALIWQVEDQQVLLCGRVPNAMPAVMRELQMVGKTGVTEHHPIESLMIFEGIEDLETEPITVESNDLWDVIGRASNT